MMILLVVVLCLVQLSLSQVPVPPDAQEDDDNMQEYCYWDTFSPRCGEGEVIYIIRASYGRPHTGRCIHPDDIVPELTSNAQYLGCTADVTGIVQATCAGLQQCDLAVRDDSLAAQNPCFAGLYVFLEVEYHCRPAQ